MNVHQGWLHRLGRVGTAMWCGALVNTASAQTAMQGVAGTNGAVHATAMSDNHLYIGGAFDLVGTPCGGWVAFNAASGAPVPAHARIAGEVRAAVGDGAGGWFLGGTLSGANGALRGGLVHLAADGSVLPWAPMTNGPVYALALRAGVLFVGGFFSSVEGEQRVNLAAVDATTGALLPWNANTNGRGVNTLELVGDTLFAGGGFSNVSSIDRSGIAALDAGSGAVLAWDAHLNPGGGTTIVYKLVRDGARLYVGGSFDRAGAQAARGFVALDIAAASPIPGSPNFSIYVSDIAILGGSIYLAGFISSTDTATRNGLAALSRMSLNLTPWNPTLLQFGEVATSLTTWGGTVYVAASSQAHGRFFARLAAIDTLAATTLSWSPSLTAVSGPSVLRSDGNAIFMGGDFTFVDGVPRRCLAEIDLRTGQVTNRDFSAPTDYLVANLAIVGGQLYVNQQAGAFADQLFSYDLSSGGRTAWNPAPDGFVSRLMAHGGRLFATGSFHHVGPDPREALCELDPVTGAATPWAPVLDANGEDLAADDDRLFVSGSFRSVNGAPRQGLASFRLPDLELAPWTANIAGTLTAMCPTSGALVVGGYFSRSGGPLRMDVAALDAVTGIARPWDPMRTSLGSQFNAAGAILEAEGKLLLAANQQVSTWPWISLLETSLAAPGLTIYSPAPDRSVHTLGGRDGVLILGGIFHFLGPVACAGVGIVTSPSTAVAHLPTVTPSTILVRPDPARDRLTIRLTAARGKARRLDILDIAGRRLRSFGNIPDGAVEFDWDLRRSDGTSVPPGVLLAVMREPGLPPNVTRFVVVR